MSTPPGEGAVAIIRISGPGVHGVLEAVFRGGKVWESPRRLMLGKFCRKEEVLDTGLAVFFRAPASYTGEDMAELHTHGGIHVSAGVLEAVLEAGARAAEPGEFTCRAFLNGKMDLTQAEAVMDVIRARTPLALRAAREQLEGALGREAERLRGDMLALVANVEAWIDFPEEDISPAVGEELGRRMEEVLARVEALRGTARSGRIFREGVRVVLWGEPNAGKSSLLNRLLGYERAIVDAQPGTTRDTIEELACLGGLPFRITDTAGLRETAGRVEQEGMARAVQAREGADLAIQVLDATTFRGPWPKDGLTVLNKCDLLGGKRPELPENVLAISCRTGEGICDLVRAMVTWAGVTPGTCAAAVNARQQACLAQAAEAIRHARQELAQGSPAELVAMGLREALEGVGRLTGAADAEEILGEIFSTFCIGK